MARGDQFVLLILGFFFIQSLIAFAIFAGFAWIWNQKPERQRKLSLAVTGTVGVVAWTVRNIFVHAMDPTVNYDRFNADAFWAVVIPALALLAIAWLVQLVIASLRAA